MLAYSAEAQAKSMLETLEFLGAAAVAFRYNVFALLPAILLAWALVIFAGVLTSISAESIAFEMIVAVIVLQLGYLAGIVLKWALAAHRRPTSDEAAVLPKA